MTTQDTPQVIAAKYLNHNIAIIPIPHTKKAPLGKGWQDLRITKETIPEHFTTEKSNFGFLLGDASNGLIDIDLDILEATETAKYFFPSTACFGRKSNPHSHLLFYCSNVKYQKYSLPASIEVTDASKRVIVEVRSTGQQTIAPESIHPSGELIYWESEDRTIQPIDKETLHTAVTKTVCSAMLARLWKPLYGGRQVAALCLAGALLNSGWKEDDVKNFIAAVVVAGGDEEAKTRLKGIEHTIERKGMGKPIYGWPSLADYFSDDVILKLREWLNIKDNVFDKLMVKGALLTETKNVMEWQTPEPLLDTLPPVEQFDIALLPINFQAWIKDVSERMQCPVDFAAIGAMVALASVVGRHVMIQPKQHDSWLVVPNLWGGIVGRAGTLKTPALQEVMRPLRSLEEASKQQYDTAAIKYKAGQLNFDIQKKQLINQVASENSDKSESDIEAFLETEKSEPSWLRYIVNDCTVEKLGELLTHNPNGLLMFRDELTGWLRMLEREDKGADRAFYLESWNGDAQFTYDRIGRGTVSIPSCCISVLGGIQPAPLMKYLRHAVNGTKGDDGLLQRLQLFVWPDQPTTWKNVDRKPDVQAAELAHEVFNRLSKQEAYDTFDTMVDARFSSNTKPVVKLSEKAHQLFLEFRQELEHKLQEQEHPALESHLSKYRSLIPSIALLIHLADNHSGDINESVMIQALAWAEYLESHAKRLYATVTGGEVQTAKLLLKRIQNGDLNSPFTIRKVYGRKKWSGLNDRLEVTAAVELLTESNYLREELIKTGGRTLIQYHVNPEVLSHG